MVATMRFPWILLAFLILVISAHVAKAATTLGVSWANATATSSATTRAAFRASLAALEVNYIETDAQGSSSKQIGDITDLLKQDVAVLIIDPVDDATALRIAEEARSWSVPVVAMGTVVASPDIVSVDFDYRAAGREIASAMIEENPNGGFLLLYDDQELPQNRMFLEGQREVLRPAASDGTIRIVEERINEEWTPDNARKNMEQFITDSGADVDAVIVANGGVGAVLAETFADAGTDHQFVVGTLGTDIDALKRITGGSQEASIWLDQRELGKATIETALKLAMGESVEQAVLLRPQLITQNNLSVVVDAGWVNPEQICGGSGSDLPGCINLPRKHRAVPVFFGTDRRRTTSSSVIEFNDQRSGQLELGLAEVTIPEDHRFGDVERPTRLNLSLVAITLEKEDPQKHFTIASIKTLDRDQFRRLAEQKVAAAERYKGHALVFVHGFNVKFKDALYSTAQLVWDMQFDGLTALYSWPSKGTVRDYFYDVDSARQSRDKMSTFLDLVQALSGVEKVTLIAHSMGSAALIEALGDQASRRNFTPYSDIIFAAPDVDVDDFTSLASRIITYANGVTLYVSANDRALLASKSLRSDMPRAGDTPSTGPITIAGIDTIDASAVSNYLFSLNHSYFASDRSVVDDIAALLMSGVRPPDKRSPTLKTVNASNGAVYWQFPR